MSKLFKIFSTILFLVTIICVGSITFQVAKAIVDLYLYPNIADIKGFCIILLTAIIGLLLFTVSYVIVVLAKPAWTIFLKEILFLICGVIFYATILFTVLFLDSCVNRYTKDIDNYLQTDSSTLNEELSGFFPDKETVARYDDNNVKLEYEYWFYYIPFANAVPDEHRTTLKMDFSSNPELFEDHKQDVISESEYEVATDGEVTTIVIKDEELIVQGIDKVTYLYNIVIDSESLTVTYFAKKQVDVIIDD